MAPHRVPKWWHHGLLLEHSDGSKQEILAPGFGQWVGAVVITDPRTAWNCLEPVSMSMKSCDVALRYSIHMCNCNVWYPAVQQDFFLRWDLVHSLLKYIFYISVVILNSSLHYSKVPNIRIWYSYSDISLDYW